MTEKATNFESWLHGVMEVGASIGLSIFEDGKLVPNFAYGMHKAAIDFLADSIPSDISFSVQEQSEGHSKVQLRADAFSYILDLVGHRLVSMETAVSGIIVLLNEVDFSEKPDDLPQYIEQLRARRDAITRKNRYEDLEPQSYEKLVKDPAFVAGLLDNRGLIYNVTASHEHRNAPTLQVTSKNLALLQALVEEYGGSIQEYNSYQQEVEIDGRKSYISNQSYYWRLTSGKVRTYLPLWIPHMQIKPYSGWERVWGDEKKQQNLDLAEEIRSFFHEQLALYENGVIERLFSNDEIRNHFGIATNNEFLWFRQLIGEDSIIDKINAIRNSENQRKFGKENTQIIVKLVENHVSAYREGTEPRIFTIEMLTKMLEGEGYSLSKTSLRRYLESNMTGYEEYKRMVAFQRSNDLAQRNRSK